jgi:hypothetical protein
VNQLAAPARVLGAKSDLKPLLQGKEPAENEYSQGDQDPDEEPKRRIRIALKKFPEYGDSDIANTTQTSVVLVSAVRNGG